MESYTVSCERFFFIHKFKQFTTCDKLINQKWFISSSSTLFEAEMLDYRHELNHLEAWLSVAQALS